MWKSRNIYWVTEFTNNNIKRYDTDKKVFEELQSNKPVMRLCPFPPLLSEDWIFIKEIRVLSLLLALIYICFLKSKHKKLKYSS